MAQKRVSSIVSYFFIQIFGFWLTRNYQDPTSLSLWSLMWCIARPKTDEQKSDSCVREALWGCRDCRVWGYLGLLRCPLKACAIFNPSPVNGHWHHFQLFMSARLCVYKFIPYHKECTIYSPTGRWEKCSFRCMFSNSGH